MIGTSRRGFLGSLLAIPAIMHAPSLFAAKPEVVDEVARASTYAETVCVDSAAGSSGTTFPYGTRQHPVNNMADARIIAKRRGRNSFHIRGNVVIASPDME